MVQQLLFFPATPFLCSCCLLLALLPSEPCPVCCTMNWFTITTGQHTWRAILALTHAVSVIKERAPHFFA
jgi:hypothetical protein